jgi:hypothetical protein
LNTITNPAIIGCNKTLTFCYDAPQSMPPTEAEILAARLARMKTLIDALEDECSTSEEQRQRFLRLRAELAAARLALKPFDTQ